MPGSTGTTSGWATEFLDRQGIWGSAGSKIETFLLPFLHNLYHWNSPMTKIPWRCALIVHLCAAAVVNYWMVHFFTVIRQMKKCCGSSPIRLTDWPRKAARVVVLLETCGCCYVWRNITIETTCLQSGLLPEEETTETEADIDSCGSLFLENCWIKKKKKKLLVLFNLFNRWFFFCCLFAF